MLRNLKLVLFLLICSLIIYLCREKWVDTNLYDQGNSKFIKDIPITKEGRNKGQPDFFYRLVKSNSLALKLDSLETGFVTLQIRVWLGHSMAIKNHVVILKLIDRHWHAELITYEYSDGSNPLRIKRETRLAEINPNNGWKNLIENLHKLDIMNLPNVDNMPGYHGSGADGINYCFEKATQSQYRFYYYPNPMDNPKFWQAKNVMTFAKLLEEEFNFVYIK